MARLARLGPTCRRRRHSTSGSRSSSFTGEKERYLLGAERLAAFARELKDEDSESLVSQVVQRFTGVDLLESTYTPPMSYFPGHARAYRLVEAADLVTATEGTGLVHTAGAFGEADKTVTDREGIEPVVPVAKDGTWMVASESVTLEGTGHLFERHVAPGEAVLRRD